MYKVDLEITKLERFNDHVSYILGWYIAKNIILTYKIELGIYFSAL